VGADFFLNQLVGLLGVTALDLVYGPLDLTSKPSPRSNFHLGFERGQMLKASAAFKVPGHRGLNIP
jgi:hypothetical protein